VTEFLFWLAKLLLKFGVGGLLLTALYWFFSGMSDGAKKFWTGVFSDNGVPSFSRVATALICVASVTWISFIVYFKREIPDVGGVVLLIETLYGINVAGTAAAKIGGSSSPGQ
jgi:hypothetical protein